MRHIILDRVLYKMDFPLVWRDLFLRCWLEVKHCMGARTNVSHCLPCRVDHFSTRASLILFSLPLLPPAARDNRPVSSCTALSPIAGGRLREAGSNMCSIPPPVSKSEPRSSSVPGQLTGADDADWQCFLYVLGFLHFEKAPNTSPCLLSRCGGI